MNKKEWKTFYRLLRISRKKAEKAMVQAMSDLMLYGTSVVIINSKGGVERIHPKDITIERLVK